MGRREVVQNWHAFGRGRGRVRVYEGESRSEDGFVVCREVHVSMRYIYHTKFRCLPSRTSDGVVQNATL